jgi:hypothetical protein
MVQEKKPIEDRRIEGGVVEWWSGGERLPGHSIQYIIEETLPCMTKVRKCSY